MRKNGRFALGLVGALLLAPVAASGAPDAGATAPKTINPKRVEEARAHFAEGLKNYDQGAFAPAKTQFEKAYELAPSYKLLYNLGLVYRQLDNPALAIHSLEGYLSQGAWEIPDERVTEVTKIVSELTPKVASAKVTANIAAAHVTVDDTFVGQTPIEDVIVLNPGQHRIVAKHDGRVTDSQVINASAGEVIQVQLDLKELPSEVPYGRLVMLTILVAAVGYLASRAARKKAPAD